VAAFDIDEQLSRRYDLSFEEYGRVHDAHNHEKERELEEFTVPSDEFVFTGWGRMNERKYEYVD